MKRHAALIYMASFLAVNGGASSAQMPAPPPSFTISASNITMPNSGQGLIPFTLTSRNGFTGSIVVECLEPTQPAGVREPVCGGGPIPAPIALAANTTATGDAYLMAYVLVPAKVDSRLNLQRSTGANWALAGLLMLGFGLRRRKARWSAQLLLAMGMLIGLTGISACSSGPVTLTPGIYTYTITASEQNNASPAVSATATVTVPPGVYVLPAPTPY